MLEKLSIDSITIGDDLSKFPVDGSMKEMTRYLDDLDFSEIEMPDSWREVQKRFKNVKYSTYTNWESDSGAGATLVILVDSNIHKKDLFIILNTSRTKRNYLIFYDIENKNFHNINDAVNVSKEEWLKEINK